jgi:hypothetical protein
MIFKNVNYILLLFQAMERNCYIFCWIFKSEKDLSWKYVHKCYNPILSPFMNYHRIWNKNSTTGATSWARNAFPSRTHAFTPLCSVLYIIVCLFSFDLCIACPPSNYNFWLPLWYLQKTPPSGIGDLSRFLLFCLDP